MSISQADLDDLHYAKSLLENPGLAAKIVNIIGTPLEKGFDIMLRSIADIGRSEGQSLDDPRTKIACMEVFALGGKSTGDDAVESGYFTIRSGLAKAVNDAAQHLARKGLNAKSSPVLLKLITQIASRFGVQVSEKIAAQAIPIIGAAGGAVINTLFIDHFQAMARVHFIVLRLEQKYGQDTVKNLYAGL